MPWITLAGNLGDSYRSSLPQMLCKKVLKNFTKFTGHYLCQSLRPVPDASHFVKKKKTLTQVFSCEFCEFFRSTFFKEHLRWLLLYLITVELLLGVSIFVDCRDIIYKGIIYIVWLHRVSHFNIWQH